VDISALIDLALPDISVDQHTHGRARNETSHLADQFRLTLCDAAYLELARRRDLPLATLGRALRDAAIAVGTTILGWA
jgi:predicted nucleic acid-binding protein